MGELAGNHVVEEAEGSNPSAGGKRTALLVASAATVALLLLVTAGGASYLAFTNRHRADRWQARSSALQKDLAELNGILVIRSDALDERTAQANDLAEKVKDLEQAVARSENDVRSLERRQRELANEKAQVEDQRGLLEQKSAALNDVAHTYSQCTGGLTNLLQAAVYEDYGWISANGDAIVATCNQAAAGLRAWGTDY